MAAGAKTTLLLRQAVDGEDESVVVGGEQVRIPRRLYFGQPFDPYEPGGDVGLMVSGLRTRSADGYERQAAAARLLADPRPWSAPFLVLLMGEYVVEILQDVEAALSPRLLDILVPYLADNPAHWRQVQARVASYWNAYYRDIARVDYVGFRLLRSLNAALSLRLDRATRARNAADGQLHRE